MEKTSEELSNIKSAIETSIGGNDLQWDLNEDYIPKRTEIEVDEQKRIISFFLTLSGVSMMK